MTNFINKLYWIIFIFNSAFSQNIKWNALPIEDIDPTFLIGHGQLQLNNGEVTQPSEIIINFEDENLSYWRTDRDEVFKMDESDFRRISIKEYRNGAWMDDWDFFYEIPDEIGASLRKELFDNEALNEVLIRSVVKEGFFNRKSANFVIGNDLELEVSNGADIFAKILAIGPKMISYLDSEGDLWLRNPKKVRSIGQSGGSRTEQARKNKIARRQAKILNLQFGEMTYPNITSLYNLFYEQYESNALEAIEEFKSSLIGITLDELLDSWGPFTQKEKINESNVMLVWSWEKKVSETSGYSQTDGFTAGYGVEITEANGAAVGFTKYNADSQSNIYKRGSNIVIDNYTKANKSSYLNFYSKSITNSFSYTRSMSFSNSFSRTVTEDSSKKIGVILNSQNNVIKVILNNYFTYPQWGDIITFYY